MNLRSGSIKNNKLTPNSISTTNVSSYNFEKPLNDESNSYDIGTSNENSISHKSEFNCQKCEKAFTDESTFEIHAEQCGTKRTKPNVDIYQCKLCLEDFESLASLYNHTLTHVGSLIRKATYKCTECSIIFSFADGIQTHLSAVHNMESLFKCQFCDKKFTNYRIFYLHYQKHENVGIFKCLDCKKSFEYHKRMLVHYKKIPHARENTLYKCVYYSCTSKFTSYEKYKIHLNIHLENPTKFVLIMRGNSSWTWGELLNRGNSLEDGSNTTKTTLGSEFLDLNKNTKDENDKIVKGSNLTKYEKFKCVECNRDFSALGHLTMHMQIHKGYTVSINFKCNICSDIFLNSEIFEIHLKENHDIENEFKCEFCDQIFDKIRSLRVHLASHSNDGFFQCEKCFAYYYNKKSMSSHLKFHFEESLLTCKCKACGSISRDFTSFDCHFFHHVDNPSEYVTITYPNNTQKELLSDIQKSAPSQILADTENTEVDVKPNIPNIDITANSASTYVQNASDLLESHLDIEIKEEDYPEDLKTEDLENEIFIIPNDDFKCPNCFEHLIEDETHECKTIKEDLDSILGQ